MAPPTGVDTNPEYWKEYSNLQKVKHDLIRHYLNGWFPKLGSWAGRIVYLDTHAGRGRHLGGQLGSPLVALNTFLQHTYRDRLLQKSEVRFYFIERDDQNLRSLQKELASVTIPENIHIETAAADCFEVLRAIIASLREKNQRLAPAFIFVDPYGFKVPGAILREVMRFQRVELFVNIIWRELDMALAQRDKPGMAELLNLIFDGDQWRDGIASEDSDERAEQAVNLLRAKTGARWATYVRMLGDNNATRYLLLHLTNHDAGRDLMKECIWKVCPEGGFYARRSDNTQQQFLITPEPDLTPLRAWVLQRLSDGPKRWKNLIAEVRAEIWREPHLNQVIRELRKERIIDGDQYTGRFTPSSNPRLFTVSAET